MKNVMRRLAVCGLCVSMLAGTGCGNTADTAKSSKGKENIEIGTSAAGAVETKELDTVLDLQAKYADQEKYEYTDPIYNLEKDHNFTYDIGEKFYDADECEAFKVYADSAFENFVNITIEEDIDTNTLTISPNQTFSYDVPESSSATDGTWGTRSKFWLVQYLDTETGEALEKPLVTVFSIQQEMNTPTLKHGVGADGYYNLSWSEVAGADYYEVYEYDADIEYAELVLTTENLSCSNAEFAAEQAQREQFQETYEGTEVDVESQWGMNHVLDEAYGYFVVARSEDGKRSGMSNECAPRDIMNQIPITQSWDFPTEYTGSDILALPAYVDIEMMDGSIGKYPIEYHGATATLLEDGEIVVQPTIKNLPIDMFQVTLTGMDYDTFLAQTDKLTQRGDELAAKTGTVTEDIDIPFVPDSQEPGEEPEEIDEEKTEEKEKPEEVDEEKTEEKENEKPEKTVTTAGVELPQNVEETVYANSSLSEWIALNLLAHNETISMEGFKEASDSDRMEDALLEAYKQNPLCGTLSTIAYDYDTNSLVVTYVQTKEELQSMQQECLEKAEEVAKEITEESMSDYEKEVAINQYLCDNAAYNTEIMEYINEDGTISQEAVEQFSNSFTPYGVLVENLGVCESYAEAFHLIAEKAGLKSIMVTGSLEGVNHEWNRVLLDEKWYTLDVTNNDNEIAPNALCNLSDEVAAEVLKQNDIALINDYISSFAADDMKYEYYTVNGLYTEDASKAKEILASGLKENGKAVVRMDSSLGNTSLEEIIQEVVNEAQVEEVKYIDIANVISVEAE